MSNNCLVTKLKGTVQNDTLPVFNKIFLDWVPESQNPNAILLNATLCIEAVGTVTVKSSKDFHISTPDGTTSHEFSFTNTIYAFVFISSEVGNANIEKLVEIEGVYNLKKIGTYCSGYGINPLVLNKDSKEALSLNYAPLVGISVTAEPVGNTIDLTNIPQKDAIGYLGLELYGTNGSLKLPDLPNIEVIWAHGEQYPATIYGPSLYVSEIANCSKLKKIHGQIPSIRLNGTTAGLPTSLEYVHGTVVNTSLFTGAIEDFVAKCVAAGKTTGFICFSVSGEVLSNVSACSFTYNGTAIKNMVGSVPTFTVSPSTTQYWGFAWNGNTITWANENTPGIYDFSANNTLFRFEPSSQE